MVPAQVLGNGLIPLNLASEHLVELALRERAGLLSLFGQLELSAGVCHRCRVKAFEHSVLQFVESVCVGRRELSTLPVVCVFFRFDAVKIVRPDEKLHTNVGCHQYVLHNVIG